MATIVADDLGGYARTMTADTALAYLDAHAPAPTSPVSPALIAARTALNAAARDLLAVPDDRLERTWRWRDTDADVRYGAFHAIEAVETAAAEITATLAATGTRRSNAALRIAPVTTARWDLHGRLATIDDASLDTVAKDGEWTLRETLGHIVGGQRGYVVYSTWHWVRNEYERPTEAELEQIQAVTALPEDSDEATGTLAEITARIDEATDLGTRLAGLTDADLARPARWSGIPVDVGFRVGRWSSHFMEHAIQIDKTLGWLDRRPTEVERIVGELYRAWGRLEAEIFPIEPAALTRAAGGGRSVEAVLGALGDSLVTDARSIRAAAEA